MRACTYFGFAAGLIAGACLVSFNSKAKQMVTDAKEKVMQKVEETVCAAENSAVPGQN